MITSQRFKNLMNGAGAAVGAKAFANEIAVLEAETAAAHAELCNVPAKRAEMILSDDASAAIDQLENREKELERTVERNSIQLEALKGRLSQLRRTELAPRIEHHHAVMRKLVPEIEKAARSLDALNQAADAALKSALDELGPECAALWPLIRFGPVATDMDMAVEFYRGKVADEWARIARNDDGSNPSRKSPIDLDSMMRDPYQSNMR